jgi:hypothetical protein
MRENCVSFFPTPNEIFVRRTTRLSEMDLAHPLCVYVLLQKKGKEKKKKRKKGSPVEFAIKFRQHALAPRYRLYRNHPL